MVDQPPWSNVDALLAHSEPFLKETVTIGMYTFASWPVEDQSLEDDEYLDASDMLQGLACATARGSIGSSFSVDGD
jgi:hypothetical protein